MLFNGEQVGDGDGPECDVAVDPIDGTTLCAKGMDNAIAVMAVAERGTMFDPSAVFYMEKIATGPEAADVVDITAPVAREHPAGREGEGRHRRGRHRRASSTAPATRSWSSEVREAGARIKFISDGDVAGAIMAAREGTGIDLLLGIGGTPEGIIAACALKCLGGESRAGSGRRTTPSGRRRSTPATTSTGCSASTTSSAATTSSSSRRASPTASCVRGVRYRAGAAHTHSLVMRSQVRHHPDDQVPSTSSRSCGPTRRSTSTMPADAPEDTASVITVVGESLIDVVRRTDGSVSDHLGGSPFNVAVGLARLGAEVGLATRVGADEHGGALLAHLRSEGVGLLGTPEGLARTSTATATLDEDGVASYEFDLEWDLPQLPLGPEATALHTGSLGVTIEPGASTVLETMAAVRSQVLVSYDPNARPKLTADHAALVRRVEEAVALAHVVKASEEDFEFLYPDTDFRDVAARWLEGGTGARRGHARRRRRVGVDQRRTRRHPRAAHRRRGHGRGRRRLHVRPARRPASRAALSVDALDRIRGLEEAPLQRIVREAATVASITCERAGANPPTRAEVEARLAR